MTKDEFDSESEETGFEVVPLALEDLLYFLQELSNETLKLVFFLLSQEQVSLQVNPVS